MGISQTSPGFRGRTCILLSVRVVTVVLRRGSRIAHEEVVERPVLLNDKNDVLNRTTGTPDEPPFGTAPGALEAPPAAQPRSPAAKRARTL